MVQPYNGILFYHKKEQTTDACYNMDEPQNIKWKVRCKNHILYNSIYIKCPGKGNIERPKVDWWLPRVWGENWDWLMDMRDHLGMMEMF